MTDAIFIAEPHTDNDSTAPICHTNLSLGPPIPSFISFKCRPDGKKWKAAATSMVPHARQSKSEIYAAAAVKKFTNDKVSQLQIKIVELDRQLHELGRTIHTLQQCFNCTTLPPSSAVNNQPNAASPSIIVIPPIPPSSTKSPPQHKLPTSPPIPSKPTHIQVSLPLSHPLSRTILHTNSQINLMQCKKLLKWFWLKSAITKHLTK